jgi:hypothetical protein
MDGSALSGETADAYAPEVQQQHGLVTSRTDGYCLGLVVAHALVVAASTVANAGPTTKDGKPVTFEELRGAGPAALLAAMEALPVRADNGLYEMACRLLAVEPGLRPSAVGCLTGLTPGRPVTYAGVGAQSAAVLEKPYEVADWIAATDPASEAPDILAYADRHGPWVFDASACVGQVYYTRSAEEHRGTLALQLPGVRMTLPTIHAYAAGRGRQLPGSRPAHTGLVHVNVRAQDVDVIVQAANQRAYYDLEGVWLAANAEAARELAAWELVMRHYRNGTPNRLPMSLVTVERARRVFQAQ